MPPSPRTALLCSLSLAATALASPLPQLRGVQGVDDQSAVDALRAAGDVAGLDLRYATLARERSCSKSVRYVSLRM